MWNNFDGKPYIKEEFKAHVDGLKLGSWCKFITLHNTGSPNLHQWMTSGTSPQQRIKNLQHYYEVNERWHAGPHLFIDPDHIWGFTDLDVPGVHASCFNSKSIGIEMVGDYSVESFNTELGAEVRDNAVYALAVLHNKLGLEPSDYVYGVHGLHFHLDCKRDQHACPGKHVNRDDIIDRVIDQMKLLAKGK